MGIDDVVKLFVSQRIITSIKRQPVTLTIMKTIKIFKQQKNPNRHFLKKKKANKWPINKQKMFKHDQS